MKSGIAQVVPAVLGLAGAAAIALWLSAGQAVTVEARLPQAEASESAVRAPATAPAGALVKGDGAPSTLPGDWPNFRGPGFDAVAADPPKLLKTWPPDGPPRLWTIEVGEGHAAPAVHKGRVYLDDYDVPNQRVALRCLSLADGKEIWRYSYPLAVKRNHGMSRATPAVTDKYVVSISPLCQAVCLDAVTGQLLWSIDLVKTYGTVVPQWWSAQSPLIDKDVAVLAPAGPDALLVGVDCATGRAVWTTPNPQKWQMTHSSVAPMSFNGQKMYVYCGSGGVAGIDASDLEPDSAPATSAGSESAPASQPAGKPIVRKTLWETTAWRLTNATVPTPVPTSGGKILFTGGYNAGSMLVQLTETDGKMGAAVLKTMPPTEFECEQHTPVFFNNHIFGMQSLDTKGATGQIVCLDEDCNKVWDSGRDRFGEGRGPFMVIGDKLFAMDDTGVLSMLDASVTGFKRLAQAKVLPGHTSWAPMTFADGLLIVRDYDHMTCLDLREK